MAFLLHIHLEYKHNFLQVVASVNVCTFYTGIVDVVPAMESSIAYRVYGYSYKHALGKKVSNISFYFENLEA